MSNKSKWKRIIDKYDRNFDAIAVKIKVENISECKEIYTTAWDDDNNRWVFYDHNDVSCREWNGTPTHYKRLD